MYRIIETIYTYIYLLIQKRVKEELGVLANMYAYVVYMK